MNLDSTQSHSHRHGISLILAWLVFSLCVLSGFTASAVDRITAQVTVTNIAVTGNTFILNALTRTWTNANASGTILTNLAGIPQTATNLYDHIITYPYVSGSGGPLFVSMTSPTNIQLIAISGNALSVTTNEYALITYSTQTVTTARAVRVPHTAEPTASTRTNIASMLIDYISIATNSFATNNGALVNYLEIGPETHTLTAGKQILNGIYSNIVAYITGGYASNVIAHSMILTNGINYGNAFSSAGTNSNSEQFGSGATASGAQGTALGRLADASGASSTSLGFNSTASGIASVAVGDSSVASEVRSIALGFTASASVSNSVAIGTESTVSGVDSIAIGNGSIVTHTNSIALGNGVFSAATNEIRLGTTQHAVRIPGILDAATATNTFLRGTNRAESWSWPATSISTLADGANLLSPGIGSYFRLTGTLTADASLVAMTNWFGNRFLKLENETGFDITIVHNSGLDAFPVNRISTPDAANQLLVDGGWAEFTYSSSDSRWNLSGLYPEASTTILATDNQTPPGGTNWISDFVTPSLHVNATNNLNFIHSTNRLAGKVKLSTITIWSGNTNWNIAFNAGWKFIGAAAPTTINSNKISRLELRSWGSAETNVMARFLEEQ